MDPSTKTTILDPSHIETLIENGNAIVIYNKIVFKLDSWLRHHPGGDKTILHFVGRDTTDQINAYLSLLLPPFLLRQLWSLSTASTRKKLESRCWDIKSASLTGNGITSFLQSSVLRMERTSSKSSTIGRNMTPRAELAPGLQVSSSLLVWEAEMPELSRQFRQFLLSPRIV